MWLGSTLCALFELCLTPGVPLGGGVSLHHDRTGKAVPRLLLPPTLARASCGSLGRRAAHAASTMAWAWCVYHSAGLHQLLLAAPHFCLVKARIQWSILSKKKCSPVLHKVLVTPNTARGDLEAFQQSGILLERPF